MKIKFQQFCRPNHSWSVVGLETAREFLRRGWADLQIQPTDTGDKHYTGPDPVPLPTDLQPYRKAPESPGQSRSLFDVQFSYTCPINFQNYLSAGKQNRLGYWCYEWPLIPSSFVKHHKFADFILTPSSFARDCFLTSKFPEEKIKVVPHGINLDMFNNPTPYPVPTVKSFKILVNIGQPHLRKNIDGMFRAYFKAFSQKDDVCLVAKISKSPSKLLHEVNAMEILKRVRQDFPSKNPEVKLISDFVPNIASLYQACQVVYTLSHAEAFYLPGLEALGAGCINIAPRYGGQLDFLHEGNSLLVDGQVAKAPLAAQYWESNPRNTHFEASLDDAAEKLRYAYQNYPSLLCRMQKPMQEQAKKFSWTGSVDTILQLINL